MENDSIRPSANSTQVDIWIEGKLRAITVANEAIGAFVGFDRADSMRESDYCDFVRTNLSLIIGAAKARLAKSGPLAESIDIEAGDLPRADGRKGERRQVERRKAERRKSALPRGDKPERRRSQRRSSDRRRPPKRTDS
jgi:hypothetical protein